MKKSKKYLKRKKYKMIHKGIKKYIKEDIILRNKNFKIFYVSFVTL